MNLARLQVVSNQLPDPPYPSDVLARGWGFTLHAERIDNSDTWDDAPPDMRPWLLMLWYRSWTQAPCGTLPNNDGRIASRIGMDPRVFAANRDILMRGWYLASDGRLYHPVITELVEKMRDSRRVEREKKAARRGAAKAANPAKCPEGLPGESHGSPPTGTGTGTGTGSGDSEANASGADAPVQPVDAIFALGLPLLTTAGVSEKNARSMLGLLRKTAKGKGGDAAVLGAIRQCVREQALNPVAFLQGCLKVDLAPLNKQEALETRNRAVADAWAKERGQ